MTRNSKLLDTTPTFKYASHCPSTAHNWNKYAHDVQKCRLTIQLK